MFEKRIKEITTGTYAILESKNSVGLSAVYLKEKINSMKISDDETLAPEIFSGMLNFLDN
jgi:hypothetical protein